MSRSGIYDLEYGFIPDDDCPQEPPKPTNADRIRSMTDEELADKVMCYIRCDGCKEAFHIDCDVLKTCRGMWLEWLRKEVDDG